MTSSDEITADAPDGVSISEHRRPGRIENISPALLPLLRGDGPDNRRGPQSDRDDLDSARGVMSGAVIGAGVWSSGALFCYLIYTIIAR
jgi:hypothetical protein